MTLVAERVEADRFTYLLECWSSLTGYAMKRYYGDLPEDEIRDLTAGAMFDAADVFAELDDQFENPAAYFISIARHRIDWAIWNELKKRRKRGTPVR